MILPGATLGMLGGGQLGRMFTVAAQRMGYRVVVLDPDPNSPTGALAEVHLQTDYRDETALASLAEQCDAVTLEFENVPAETLSFLTSHTVVHPSAAALDVTRNRNREKAFIEKTGLKPAPYQPVRVATDLDVLPEGFTFPAILKSAEFGYDGKGQCAVDDLDAAREAFADAGGVECVLESRVALKREVSAVVGRNSKGEAQCFPIPENEHRNGILHRSLVPARCSEAFAEKAQQAAISLAEALDYVGVMAVEFFETQSGELLVNEIAPRTHNSGHFTLDACVCSQFEQQVRMLCDLPHGDTRLLTPVAMVNLLGDVWHEKEQPVWEEILTDPSVQLHLYGKHEARAGRKMGHFCVTSKNADALEADSETLFQRLN